ncbi:UNVERIFIED_CONTAM: Transposon Ty3-G Gag-Pol polyprotein [Sesamum indicum]
MRARRENNLCYNCDEVFVPGHKCKVRYSYVLMNEEEVKAYEEDNGQLEEQTEGVEEEDVTVSIHAMCESIGNGTLRIKGQVNGREIHILIDSGSTHSFIDEKVVRALNLETEEVTPMKVSVVDGYKLVSQKLCPMLEWEMQESKFLYPIRTLQLGGCDFVLGCDWLKSHNPVKLDYDEGTITVTHKGREIVLKTMTGKATPKASNAGPLSKLLGRRTYSLVHQLLSTHSNFNQKLENPLITGLLQRFEDHKIDLIPDAIPRKQPPYRASQSSFASLVLLVKKKDGGWRLCVDYRYLNKLTIKHKFPIPVIDELLDELHGAVYSNKIDLRSRYFQIRMRQDDISKTSFITHSGHYEFLVMPFGLCNAPGTFQVLMNQVFEPFLKKFVLIFFDDILVYSQSWNDHLLHLRKVLELLRSHRLYAKKNKCNFAQMQIEYLGHIISRKGVVTDPQKVQCMKEWPVPTSLKALRGFLGLTGYYRKFIKGYGLLSKPLTSLLKKDAFLWNDEAEEAFKHLKEVMSTAPVLALPDFTKPFVVETNASGRGIGAVLMQERRPTTYLNKALAPKNLGLSTYEKEFLALLLAVTKWKHYLQGHHFIIRTDQKSLKHIHDQRVDLVLQQKWVTKLLGLSYEVQYKKGNENRVADALSRVEYDAEKLENYAISTQIPHWMQELQMSYEGDALFQPVIQAKVLDAQSHPEYSYHSGILRKGGKLCVGSNGELRKRIIQTMHDSALRGHSGITGTLQRLKLLFFWPKVKEVDTWVKECEVCQRAKSENKAYPGLLQPLPIPKQAWACIPMDFIEGLPKSDGKEAILVIVDRLTKYSDFIALKHPYTTVSIAKIFFYHIYKLHGLPVSIVTDRNKIFTSHFWKELFGLTGVSLDMSTAYHPQTDGQTERVNQCLETYLRCMCHQHPKRWSQWISLAEFWFNTNFHSGLKATPFEALYGYPPNQLSIGLYLQSHHADVEELMKNRVKVL